MSRKRSAAKAAPINERPEPNAALREMEGQPAPAASPASPMQVPEEPFTRRDAVEVILFSCLLLASMTVTTVSASVMLAAVAVAAVLVGKRPWSVLCTRLCVPVLGLLAFALMQGFAAIYSPYDAFTASEFSKFLAAFSLAVIALARFEKKHVRGVLWGVITVCGVIALLCIDVGRARLLFVPFNALTTALGMDYTAVLEASEGLRNNGIYGDANITGAIMGMTALLGLYLVRTAKMRRKRFVACFLLGLSGMALLLCVSRGAWLCFAVAAVVYLAAARGERLRLFFLMLAAGAGLLLTGVPAMLHMTAGSALPLLLTLLSGPVIFALDMVLGDRLTAVALAHRKAGIAAAAAAAALCVVVAVAALMLTGPITFQTDGAIVHRAVTLSAGEYAVSGDWDEGVSIQVYTQSREEALMGDISILYYGPIQDAVFSLPQDGRVHFSLWGIDGAQLRTAVLSGGQEIPLSHELLPEMIAGRLYEGLFSGRSFLLRVQYDADALKIFAKSPVIGHGLASTEGMYAAVQPFFYESKYVHNHILQVMTDTGFLGLAAFLGLMLGVAWLLLRRLRQSADLLAAVLLAVWGMMNTHSLMEINFSIRPFQCVAYLLLVLAVLAYAKPLGGAAKGKNSRTAARRCGQAVAVLLCAYVAVFGVLLKSHQITQKKAAAFSTTDVEEYLNTVGRYIAFDVFNREEMKVSYINQAVRSGGSQYVPKVQRFVADLRGDGTFTGCTGLMLYYYFPIGDFEGGFAASRAAIAQKASDAPSWDYQIEIYRNGLWGVVAPDNVDRYIDGILATAAYKDDYNQGRIDPIVLTQENQTFLDAVAAIREAGMTGETAYHAMQVVQKAQK